jgi:hypothetical protein
MSHSVGFVDPPLPIDVDPFCAASTSVGGNVVVEHAVCPSSLSNVTTAFAWQRKRDFAIKGPVVIIPHPFHITRDLFAGITRDVTAANSGEELASLMADEEEEQSMDARPKVKVVNVGGLSTFQGVFVSCRAVPAP